MPFTKGHKLNLGNKYSLGYKHTDEAKRNIGLAALGENNYRWKGDEVGNKALHIWVRKHLPKTDTCFLCHEKKRLDLANLTGKYNREFKNWEYLCHKCHLYYDGTINKLLASKGLTGERTNPLTLIRTIRR